MLRVIGAVVLGYVAIVAVVFAGLSAAWLAFGADGAFRPDSYDISALWAGASLAVNIGAALVGGWLARRVARTAAGPRALAGVLVVLGSALALPVLLGAAAVPGVRPDTVPMFEAIAQARTPTWLLLLTPVIGAVGVLVGGGEFRSTRAHGHHAVQYG